MTEQPTTTIVERLVADLADETHGLVDLLGKATAADWDTLTPAAGWAVRDQVTHLAFFDDATVLALRDPAAFIRQRAELLALGDLFPDVVAERHRHLAGRDCLDWFQRSRTALLAAYRAAEPGLRLPWYGPDMGLASSATGRLMETWAHGQDVADTLGAVREPTGRLRHVADLGVRTFAFSFRMRGRPVPDTPVRVELTGPEGERWEWGPPGAGNLVTGPALDFCLVVTQRRNVADTRLRMSGPVGEQWLAIAQAFAGRPTDARPSGVFAPSDDGSRP